MTRFFPRLIVGLLTVGLLTGFTYGYKNNPQTGKPDMVVTGATPGDISGFVADTDYLTPTGSAAALTSFPILNQDTTGSAAKLTTPRTINGVSFDGSANVTVPAQELGGSAGKTVCWKTATVLGYCSTAVDGTGSCTCN